MDCEVDVQLFITCRLCLDESGSYQIIPFIKRQINYCFNIDVDPFDGLPQLICRKCKSILTDYYAIKKTFQEKQEKLQQRLTVDRKPKFEPDPDIEEVNVVHIPYASDAAVPAAAPAAPAAAAALGAGAPAAADAVATPKDGHGKSPASFDAASHSASLKSAGDKGKSKSKKPAWKKKYNKYFVCNVCNKNYLMKNAIEKHIKSHKTIMRKYDYLFKKYTTIPLNRIDTKKSTDLLQNVVYDKVKIISLPNNSSYCSYYLKKIAKDSENNIENNEKLANRVSEKRKASSESLDSDIIKGKKRNTRRICSNSSTETTVLEENTNTCNTATDVAPTAEHGIPAAADPDANDCINLDDTSSDCPPAASHTAEPATEQALLQPQPLKAAVGDYKTIQNIVTMCTKTSIKKIQSETNNTSSHSESSLKHKVLSIGRKVINKQGFSCTGLLRYMEKKDLEIKWTPTARKNQKKAHNFVRIMTKLKSRDESGCKDSGWTNLFDTFDYRNNGMEDEIERITSLMTNRRKADHADQKKHSAPEANDSNHKNKLLNKTPVANPKQLPKGKALVQVNDAASSAPPVYQSEAAIEGEPMCMPIITSTTSLYNVKETIKPSDSLTDKPAPRIKVKPASELMSERALSNQDRADDMWAFNRCVSSTPLHLADHAYDAPAAPDSQSGYVSSHESPTQTQSLVDKKQDRNDYIILNSAELPNTKTKSPFNYFKTVLIVHGIKLWDLNADLQMHPQFKCLVKFKLMMKQDTKNPIGVYLSLFCDTSSFCFVFKDASLKYFDPNQLPAYWQWELLKIYKGDVVNKIIHKAASLGAEVEEYTRHFLCLLQSINLVTES